MCVLWCAVVHDGISLSSLFEGLSIVYETIDMSVSPSEESRILGLEMEIQRMNMMMS